MEKEKDMVFGIFKKKMFSGCEGRFFATASGGCSNWRPPGTATGLEIRLWLTHGLEATVAAGGLLYLTGKGGWEGTGPETVSAEEGSVRLPEDFSEQITQQVETQKQVLAQREIEAQQKVATAKGEAESILVVAQGQAKANDALSRSISPILVQYKGVEKWNGVLPQVSGGAVPLIDLGKMDGSPSGAEGTKK
jgi:regulator of protease activity HflC (stomatin/prohibitin superfamily)